MGNSRDQLTRNVINATTSIQYASTATSRATVASGMLLNSAEIREATATLKNNNALPFADGGFKVIIHPYTESDLFNDPAITNAFSYAGERGSGNPIFQGKLGRYLGNDFYVTTNATATTAAGVSVGTTNGGAGVGATVYRTLFIGDRAYGVVALSALTADLIYHAPGSSGVFDPLDQLWSQGYKFSHAAAILDNTWIVSVEHVVSQGVY